MPSWWHWTGTTLPKAMPLLCSSICTRRELCPRCRCLLALGECKMCVGAGGRVARHAAGVPLTFMVPWFVRRNFPTSRLINRKHRPCSLPLSPRRRQQSASRRTGTATRRRLHRRMLLHPQALTPQLQGLELPELELLGLSPMLSRCGCGALVAIGAVIQHQQQGTTSGLWVCLVHSARWTVQCRPTRAVPCRVRIPRYACKEQCFARLRRACHPGRTHTHSRSPARCHSYRNGLNSCCFGLRFFFFCNPYTHERVKSQHSGPRHTLRRLPNAPSSAELPVEVAAAALRCRPQWQRLRQRRVPHLRRQMPQLVQAVPRVADRACAGQATSPALCHRVRRRGPQHRQEQSYWSVVQLWQRTYPPVSEKGARKWGYARR